MRYHVYHFPDKMDNFEFLGPHLPKNGFWGGNFKNLSGFGISILEKLCAPIFRQNGQLWIFGPKLAQKWILGSEFQKSKSRFGINTSKIPRVPILSQNGQLLIFRPKFGEIAQLRPIFWFKYCWGCCRELSGGWNELGGGGWSWAEVEMSWVEEDGAGWRWVHGLVIPIFISKVNFKMCSHFWNEKLYIKIKHLNYVHAFTLLTYFSFAECIGESETNVEKQKSSYYRKENMKHSSAAKKRFTVILETNWPNINWPIKSKWLYLCTADIP